MVAAAQKLRDTWHAAVHGVAKSWTRLSDWTTPWKGRYEKHKQCIKEQRYHFADECPYSQNYAVSCSHIQMWELDHKEGWQPKNWCFWIVVLEKTLENLLDSKENKPVNPKGNQPWIFIGRTLTEALILWSPDVKSWLMEKLLKLGKTEGKRRRGQQRMIWLDSIIDSVDIYWMFSRR